MKIREMEEKDNQAMENIIRRSLESVGLDIPGTAYFDPQLSNLWHFYQQQTYGNYWVAVNEADTVIGGVGIGPFGEYKDVGELQKLYVDAEFQGQGFATQLMQVALDFAKKHYTYCYLETSHILEAASSLYVKLGFRQLEKPLDGSEHGTMDMWFIKEL